MRFPNVDERSSAVPVLTPREKFVTPVFFDIGFLVRYGFGAQASGEARTFRILESLNSPVVASACSRSPVLSSFLHLGTLTWLGELYPDRRDPGDGGGAERRPSRWRFVLRCCSCSCSA